MQAQAKTKFKKTPIGEIPEDWEVVRLGEIGKLKDGDWILKKYYDNNGEVRLLQVGDIGIGKFLDRSQRFINKKTANELNVTYVKPGKHILISRMPDPIGRACIAPNLPYPYIVAVDITMLEVNENIADIEYVMWVLNSPFCLRQAKQLSSGATRDRISRKNLEKILIPLPPLPEQKKIAEILRTVDDAIEKTDEAIERTERLKKGLMQRLLTKGIKHERFKKTELGEIPEEWRVVRLGEVCTRRNEIVQPKGDGKYKFIGLEHIESGRIKISNYGSDKEVKSSKFKFYPGDILYGKLRPYLDKAVIADFEGICSTDLLVLTTKIDETLPEFLIYVIHSKGFINYAIATTSGTNHPRTSWKAISKYKFGLPPLEEQKQIAEILSTVDRRLELLRQKRGKLERVKRGLMKDLLTGRRRVMT